MVNKDQCILVSFRQQELDVSGVGKRTLSSLTTTCRMLKLKGDNSSKGESILRISVKG